MDKSGHLYGTTNFGGAHGSGTVFELTPNVARTEWTETVLYSFCTKGGANCTDGAEPAAGLIMDRSGHLYGTTGAGGARGGGTVFELTPNAARTGWTESVLHSFCTNTNCRDGDGPIAGLIMDKSRNLYGTTELGSARSFGDGTVFELTPNAARTQWTETVLYSFCAKFPCNDGEYPYGSVILEGSGHLYGTTNLGGAHNAGTVFELIPNAARTQWTETVLHSFCADVVKRAGVSYCIDGALPEAGLTMVRSGHLYGTTVTGGASFVGGGDDGFEGVGTVFELTPKAARTGWIEIVLRPKTGCIDGGYPQAGLILDGSGNLYGTTTSGGALYNGGVVFELKP